MKVCTRCIMDETDPAIQFDEEGICNHCKDCDEQFQRIPTDKPGALKALIEQIRTEGKGKPYDCIIGVSGGVDSTYVAYQVKQLGLRALAIHFDNGWNSELAVHNIEKLLNKLKIELYTYVVDWEEFKDLQMAFLKASVTDGEVPTDHGILGILNRMAIKEGVRYVLSGVNTATEGILPRSWTYATNDWRYVKSVHRSFGTVGLKTFPHYTLADRLIGMYLRRIQYVPFLDYFDYDKKAAIGVMEKELGWQNYGGKHYESIYTRFFQGYILPVKFHVDKRKAHLSTLICSGQISREQALAEMQKPLYPSPEMLKEDMAYVIDKFGITREEFDRIMALPKKTYRDYDNQEKIVGRLRGLASYLRKKP